MAKNSSNEGSIDSELKIEKKSRKKKAKQIDEENEEILQSDDKVKAKKQKRKEKQAREESEETPSKKSKKSKSNKAVTDDGEPSEEKEEETSDVKKPKQPSKRQQKKEKQEQRELDKKEASKLETMSKALNYISIWKNYRSSWKFEKLKQIWLMDHLLDENSVSDSVFPTVLEYFEGCKGMARETLLKKGMSVIKKHEEKQEESEEVEETIEYKRARQLLQALPTES